MPSRFFATTRMRFHCRVHGDADGLPMLLLHGSFASSRWWEPLFAVLPDAILAIAPDLRGCGQSDRTVGGYTIQEQAEDIWSLVQALDWHDFDLVGHSSGGAIAIEFALNHSDTLHSLTLVDSAPVEGVYTPVDGIIALDRMQSDRALLRKALVALLPGFTGAVHEPAACDSPQEQAFFEQLVDDAWNMAPAAFTATANALNHWNRFGDVQRLTLPVLLVWGELDHIVERDAVTRSLIAIPGAHNLEVLHHVGHSPMIEAPEILAEKVLEFILEDFGEFNAIRGLADPNND